MHREFLKSLLSIVAISYLEMEIRKKKKIPFGIARTFKGNS